MVEVPKKLLKIICCPVCKSDLKYIKRNNKLICDKCKKNFEIREGIPILLL